MKRPIAIQISPNTQFDDVVLSAKLLLSMIKWFDVGGNRLLEEFFEKYYGKGYRALSINSGRSALYLILKSLNLNSGDEVVVQALTCVAVPNAVKWNGARVTYADVDQTFNLDPKDLKKKITKNTKAVIVQHSFGVPAQIDSIRKILKNRKIVLIEDCALSLGATYKGKKVGTFGDYAFFSFGRDKVISSVFGGLILVPEGQNYESLFRFRSELIFPPFYWVIQQLLHPLIFALAMPTYHLGFGKFTFGKMLIYTAQKLRFVSRAIYGPEKSGRKPSYFPQKMPGALAYLAAKQFKKLEAFNLHRQKISNYYFENLDGKNASIPENSKGAIYMRFPIIVNSAKEYLNLAKAKHIYLGDWYANVVVPVSDLRYVSYNKGSCPNAESLVGKLVNLPTYPTLTLADAEKVVKFINNV